MKPAPFTATGLVVVVLGVASYIAGWRLGWVELMVLAAGALVAMVLAAPHVFGRLRLEVERSIVPSRVMAGDTSKYVLDVRNPKARPIRRRTVEDRLGDTPLLVEVPALRAGGDFTAEKELELPKRGAYQVGPAVIAREDPLQLLRREVRQADSETLWVHPYHQPLAALPVGFAKDLEGPTSDTSPAGDVAFHALREYEPGDDFRHIHWLSTARVGSPMVRHYVDNRRPQLTVLLDNRDASLDPDCFEIAVEIGASLGVSSYLGNQPVAIWTPQGPLIGAAAPGGRDDLLDRLAVVAQVQSDKASSLERAALHAVRTESGTSVTVIITGAVDPVELSLVTNQIKRDSRVVIARVWPEGQARPSAVPGARVIDAESLRQFSRGWEQLTR